MGLGNPGSRYERTRHNLGFRVVQLLAKRHGATSWRSKFLGKLSEITALDAILLMPQTYMNASGDSVAPCASFYKISPPQILVVCDDLNLPFGRLRMRRSGSAGGHNGLASIIAGLGSEDFPRLRIGIGRAETDEWISHVIGDFGGNEEVALPQIVDRATEGVETFLRSGIDAAIALVNAYGGGPPETQTDAIDR